MYSSIGALKQIIQKEKQMKIVIEVLFYVISHDNLENISKNLYSN